MGRCYGESAESDLDDGSQVHKQKIISLTDAHSIHTQKFLPRDSYRPCKKEHKTPQPSRRTN